MNRTIFGSKIGQHLVIMRGLIIFLSAILVLVTAAGCQSNQAESATTVVEETQPPPSPSVTPLPTATPQPTATPVPPTATAEPSPTPAPTKVQAPEVVTIPYMDLDTGENPNALPQWLKIYRPAEGTAPYPTMFFLPDLVFNSINDYRAVVKEFMARGYAVVLVKYQDVDTNDSDWFLQGREFSRTLGWTSCALAWTLAYGGDYDLDLNRLVIFSHEGADAARLPLYDEAMWSQTLSECAHPIPAPDAVKGFVSFDVPFALLDSSLRNFPGKFGEMWGIPQEDVMRMTDILGAVSPEDWYKEGVLDADTHQKFARLLPLYWVYKTGSEGTATPVYLLIYDKGGKDIFDYAAESEGMAEHMRKAGIDVTLQVLPDANGWDLTDPSTDVAERVVEAADKFISKLFN